LASGSVPSRLPASIIAGQMSAEADGLKKRLAADAAQIAALKAQVGKKKPPASPAP